MSRPVLPLDRELPGHILRRREWIRDMEVLHQNEADRSMSLVPWLAVLGLLVSAIAVVVWA